MCSPSFELLKTATNYKPFLFPFAWSPLAALVDARRSSITQLPTVLN